MKKLPFVAIAAPALTLVLGVALSRITVVSARDVADASGPRHAARSHALAFDIGRLDRAAPPRRWPAEIEQLLLSSMPQAGDEFSDAAPMIETDQRCSRVEDGLAHCVMLECQSTDGQTACFEMVVTARRLREPPVSMRDGGGDADEDAPEPPGDDDGDSMSPSLQVTRATSRL